MMQFSPGKNTTPGRFRKIFGIGLPKTGTTSLGKALRIAGFSKAPYDAALVDRVLDGDLSSVPQVLESYDCFEDWPWPLIYKTVHEWKPDAGFVLTVRQDPRRWFESVRKHAERNPSAESTERRKRIFGTDELEGATDLFIERYLTHLKEVEEYFSDNPERFLRVCWEDGDGWTELCSFLEIKKPLRPFPKANTARSRSNLLRRAARSLRKQSSLDP